MIGAVRLRSGIRRLWPRGSAWIGLLAACIASSAALSRAAEEDDMLFAPQPSSVETLDALPSEPLPADAYLAAAEQQPCCPRECMHCCPGEPWHWQILPDGLIYRSYLAGPKEPRMASVWFNDPDDGYTWDVTLGGRVGLLRYGTSQNPLPDGWELDIEGAALLRLDPVPNRDLTSGDFRFGIPLTYGEGPYQTKFAYYHLSSHLADEFMLLNPGYPRLNYTRDAFVYGNSYYYTSDLRLYAEVEYCFNVDGGAEPWAFQFGVDYSPLFATGFKGAPFAAINAYLREEVDFGGTICFQTGWQWRSRPNAHLLRVGLHYLNGKSPQFEFFNRSEQQLGGGIWYDY